MQETPTVEHSHVGNNTDVRAGAPTLTESVAYKKYPWLRLLAFPSTERDCMREMHICKSASCKR